MTPTFPRFGASGHTGAVRSSAHGAVRLVRDALATLRRANVTGPVLVRADSAYYQQALVAAAIVKTDCQFSVGRLNKCVPRSPPSTSRRGPR